MSRCRYLIIYTTCLAAAIDFIYLGSVEQIDFGVLCPSVLAIACAEDVGMGQSVSRVYILYRGVNIDVSVERTAITVVATIDGLDASFFALEVHVRLVHITGEEVAQRIAVASSYTVGTAIEVVHVDGRALGHIDDSAAGEALLVASTIDRIDVSADKVDDCSGSDIAYSCFCSTHNSSFYVHAYSAIVACTEDFKTGEVLDISWNINQDIAIALQQVLVDFIVISLSCTIDTCNAAIFGERRTEVDEGIADKRL